MFIYNLKLAFRYLLRQKIYTLINIVGLTVSIAFSVLIIVWIKYELSYDKFNKNADRIYRFTIENNRKDGYKAHFARCNQEWIKDLTGFFPEIESMATLIPRTGTTAIINDNRCYIQNTFYTDSLIFKVFSLNLLRGNPNIVLNRPKAVVISESFARKYFGNIDPVGKPLIISGEYDGKQWLKQNYSITGVFKDLPSNSHFHLDLLIARKTLPNEDNWQYVYLLLNTKSSPESLQNKFPALIKKYNPEAKQNEISLHIQPLTDIHLKSDKDRELEPNGSMMAIYVFGIIGIVVLLVSWINYFNLNMVGINSRFKGLYSQKTHGAININLIAGYAIETVIIVLFVSLLSVGLLMVSFPAVKTFTGNFINDKMFQCIPDTLPWLSLVFFGSIIIGSLPILSFIWRKSVLTPAVRYSGVTAKGKVSSSFREGLIVFQFTLAVTLIICSLVIKSQSNYIIEHQAGAKEDSVLVVKGFNQDVLDRYFLLKSQLLKSPYIKGVTASFEEPFGLTMDAMGFETPGIKNEFRDNKLWVYDVDDNYFRFYKLPFLVGNDFTTFNEKLKSEDYILNETAVKSLGWTPEEAIGKPFKLKFSWDKVFYGGHIIGVVKDFNLNTLHHEIKPYVFFQKPIWLWNILIKPDPKNNQKAMADILKGWNQLIPEYPFEYNFNKELFFHAYKKEIIQTRLTGFFSFVAILISCMGLFAISSISIDRRTKEIGIRKTNGATTFQIIFMLSANFAKWVLCAFIISCPIAWYAMHKWLQNFAYKMELSWWIFAFAGFIAMVIALVTVSWQSWRAATRNPVESLRYE
jgi:putative ABC transport system permease protein